MPIHYDTIEDGQNKNNNNNNNNDKQKTDKETSKQTKKMHLLFSFLVSIVLFLHFIWRVLFVKKIITSFNRRHFDN